MADGYPDEGLFGPPGGKWSAVVNVFTRIVGIAANTALLSFIGLRTWATVTVPDLNSEVFSLRMVVFVPIVVVCLMLLVGVLLARKLERAWVWTTLSILWLFIGLLLSIVIIPWF